MADNVYPNTFKTKKVGEGKEVKYELYELVPDGKDKIKEKKIGDNVKLMGAKEDARQYVIKVDAKYTTYTMIHHKPGREKDAKEVLKTKKAM